jgi:hypothetical protein
MSEHRPHTFAWVQGPKGPMPYIIFNDPRTGCGDLKILAEYPLEPDDLRTIDQLAAVFPAPMEAN